MSALLTMVLVLMGCIFDGTFHGIDYWYFRTETDDHPNEWSDRAAILSTFPLFIGLILAIEYFKLDLISGWIVANAVFLLLNAAVYFNFSYSMTFFATFLLNGVYPMTEIFVVSLLLLNEGTGLSNLIATGIPFSVGMGIYKLFNYAKGIQYHQEAFLVLLILRILVWVFVIVARFATNLTDFMTVSPSIRGIGDIWDATSRLDPLKYSIVWSNIIMTSFSILVPNIFLGEDYDRDTNTIALNPQTDLGLICLEVLTPLWTIILAIYVLSHVDKQFQTQHMFIWSMISGMLSFMLGIIMIRVTEKGTTERIVFAVLYTLCFANMICVLSVVSDAMVLCDDVYGLNLYIKTRAVAIAQLVMMIASFVEYKRWTLSATGFIGLCSLANTLRIYLCRTDVEESLSTQSTLRRATKSLREDTRKRHESYDEDESPTVYQHAS